MCRLPQVSFELFLLWWKRQHEAEDVSVSGPRNAGMRGMTKGASSRRGNRYTQRFKLMMGKLMTEFDPAGLTTENEATLGTTEFRIRFKYDDGQQVRRGVSMARRPAARTKRCTKRVLSGYSAGTKRCAKQALSGYWGWY